MCEIVDTPTVSTAKKSSKENGCVVAASFDGPSPGDGTKVMSKKSSSCDRKSYITACSFKGAPVLHIITKINSSPPIKGVVADDGLEYPYIDITRHHEYLHL